MYPAIQYVQPGYPPMQGVLPAPGYASVNQVSPRLSGGITALANLDSIWIQQDAQYLEGCGCEFENVYMVYGVKDNKGDPKRDKNEVLFKCKEHSSCCQRYCCFSSMQSFNMDIMFNSSCFDPSQKGKPRWTPFLHLERDYKCTCLCFNRPSIRVSQIEDRKKETVGFVTHRWAACDYVYDMRAEKDSTPPYIIEGSCCQCGLCCSCPCGPCRKVDLGVYESDSRNKVGNISKVWTGLVRTLLTDADSYYVTFPNNVDVSYKVLMLAAAILIDYQHFEESPTDKQAEKDAKEAARKR